MSFKSVVSAASEQYQEIKRCLALFPYFETWDDSVIEECCRLSSIKEYPEDSIILGSCSENSYMTFFVLEGICKIIHHLQVQVKINSYGRTTYKLYQPTETNSSNSELTKIEYTSMLFTEMHRFQRNCKAAEMPTENTPRDEKGTEKLEEEGEGKYNFAEEDNEGNDNIIEQKPDEEEEEGGEGENSILENSPAVENGNEAEEKEGDPAHDSSEPGKPEEESFAIAGQSTENEVEVEKGNQNDNNDSSEAAETEGMENLKNEPVERRQGSQKEEERPKPPDDATTTSLEDSKNVKEEVTQEETKIAYDEDHHLRILEECRGKAKQHMRSVGQRWTKDKPKDVKSFFVQVGLFYKGSCFGLEEHLKDTVVMSQTKVKCLIIPRRFLFQHNPCNVWNRIRLFFSLHLPTEDQILQYFSSNRAWLKKKQKMSERIASTKKIPNYTLCSDIPYGIRLLQEL